MKEKAEKTKAELRKEHIKRRRDVRDIIQLIFFFWMPGFFVSGFNGIKNICRWVKAGEVIQMNSFVYSLIALCIFTILFGRFFCGYACAFGALGDFANGISGWIQKKIFKRKKQIRIPAGISRWLQKLKYLNLLFIVLMSALWVMPSGTSPWDVFSRLAALKGIPASYAIGLVCLILILIGMAFQERFFCQYLCPMGAVFALLPVLPFGELHRNEEACAAKCNICADQCPVSLKLSEGGDRSGECIACEKCKAACPRGNISGTGDSLIKVWWIPLLIKAVILFALGCALGLARF